MPRSRFRIALVLAMLSCAGCNDRSATAPPPAPAPAPATPAIAQPEVPTADDALRDQAEAAMREGRLFSPAGDNAIAHYLALRQRDGNHPRTATALADLQPYALLAAERSLADEDPTEAQRMISLLRQIDADNPALPRLTAALGLLQARIEADAQVPPTEAIAEAQALPAAIPAPAAEPAPSGDIVATPAVDPTPAHLPAIEPAAPIVQARQDAPATPLAEQAAPLPPAITPTPVRRRSPQLLEGAQPRYPIIAMNRGIQGQVQIEFTVDADGRVVNPKVRSATPPKVFDRAALDAVSRWRFEATGETHQMARNLSFSLPDRPG